MYIRITNIKFSSKIEADAMRALTKYEMLDNIEGLLSIETVFVTELHALAILKFQNKEFAEKSKEIYINKMKKNPNIKVETFEGPRDFIVEKS